MPLPSLDTNTSDGMVHLHDGSYHRPLNVITKEYDLNRCLTNSIVYMQINKVATRSIFDVMWSSPIIVPDHAYAGPIYYSDISNIPIKFMFAFVRNPYDRMVSAWKYAIMKNLCTDNFEMFIDKVENCEYDGMIYITTLPQWRFISNNGQKIDVHWLGRFETIQEDWKCLADILEKQFSVKVLAKTLRNINKSRTGEDRNYQQFYTDSTKRKVEKYCYKSFNLLHYDF